MNRELRIHPGYDRRNETPNYGQHGPELEFVVKDERGALVLHIHSGWYPDKSISHPYARIANHVPITDPHVDLTQVRDHCEYIGEACTCTYDTSLADEYIACLILEGSEGVFAKLEKLFERTIS